MLSISVSACKNHEEAIETMYFTSFYRWTEFGSQRNELSTVSSIALTEHNAVMGVRRQVRRQATTNCRWALARKNTAWTMIFAQRKKVTQKNINFVSTSGEGAGETGSRADFDSVADRSDYDTG